jgi:AAHS family 4-hydroxybenzoate transporter-like MFS transporter
MASERKLDLESLIDSSRMGWLQVTVTALCAAVAMVDGFDTQAIALVAPEIAMQWGVMPAAFGIVFAAGLFGSFVGALSFGWAGDRFGRKSTLMLAVLIFGSVTLATPFTNSIESLTLVRFLTGLGLGGALPGIISITSEYAPKRVRATVVALMFCGFPLGAVIGGVASAKLIPALGWESLFYVGSAIPLLLLPLLFFFVPESVRYLATRQDRAGIVKVLDRMKWTSQWNGDMPKPVVGGHSHLASLFLEGRALGTLLLWATLFFSLLLTYFLINWIPIVARQNGLGIESAVLGVAFLNLGSIFGVFTIGKLADHFGHARMIGAAYALGAVCIALIGTLGQTSSMLLVIPFLAGVFTIGAQMCTVALVATYYETRLRATGVGWAMGIGRMGAIFGPILGGMLLGTGMQAPSLFMIAAAFSLAAALTVLAMGWFVLRKKVVAAA